MQPTNRRRDQQDGARRQRGELAGAALSSTILADLSGLTLIAFEPVTVAGVVLGVMAIAYLAGTMPALRAARQDPISSLRYE